MVFARTPEAIDLHVGARVRRRQDLGVSRDQLADILSMTLQQLQKQAKDQTRMPASRLQAIANAHSYLSTTFISALSRRRLRGGGPTAGPVAPAYPGETTSEYTANEAFGDVNANANSNATGNFLNGRAATIISIASPAMTFPSAGPAAAA